MKTSLDFSGNEFLEPFMFRALAYAVENITIQYQPQRPLQITPQGLEQASFLLRLGLDSFIEKLQEKYYYHIDRTNINPKLSSIEVPIKILCKKKI